ncbi:hypothetical protein DL96DRAFT_1566182 [Flagelloscypha sp. PMI_526]|nr:hypothetical protein DL96DRAFT_1566182 [Flagelloscypha sp. PMI_526]
MSETPAYEIPAQPFPKLREEAHQNLIAQGYTPLKLIHRWRHLPCVYICPNNGQHLQRNKDLKTGRDYLILIDTHEDWMSWKLDLEDHIRIPNGRQVINNSIYSLGGFLGLQDGDHVFTRDVHEKGTDKERMMKDVLQVFVGDRTLYSAAQKKAFDDARDEMLGPRDERGHPVPADPPSGSRWKTERDGQYYSYKGCSTFESSSHAKPVKDGGRAYTLASSVERVPREAAPMADVKMMDGVTAEILKTRRNLIMASTALTAIHDKYGPVATVDIINKTAQLLNKAPLGVFEDYDQAHQTIQVNFGVAVTADDDDSLGRFMIFFGDTHRDEADAVAEWSTVVVNSDYPDDPTWEADQRYDPGKFFILGLGVYVDLSPYRTVSFFGQHAHVGTSIRAPPGVEPPKWATRFLMVHYSKDISMNGLVSYNLAPLRPKANLFSTPETTLVRNTHSNQWSNHTTYATDGHLLVDPFANFNFILRALFCICVYVLNYLYNGDHPAKIEANFAIFRRAFTFEGEHGTEWEYAPGSRYEEGDDAIVSLFKGEDPGPSVSQDPIRDALAKEWDTFRSHVGSHIPYIAVKGIHSLEKTYRLTNGNGVGRPSDRSVASGASNSLLNQNDEEKKKKTRKSKKKKTQVKEKTTRAKKGKGKAREMLISDSDWETDREDNTSDISDNEVRTSHSLKRHRDEDDTRESTGEGSASKKIRTLQDSGIEVADLKMIEDFVTDPNYELDLQLSQRLTRRSNSMTQPIHLAVSEDVVAMDVDINYPEPEENQRITERGPSSPPLIAQTSLDYIQTEAHLLSDALKVLQSSNSNHSVILEGIDLSKAVNSIISNALAPSTAVQISHIWSTVDHLEHREALGVIRLRYHRQLIMTLTLSMWIWLDSFLPMCLQKALRSEAFNDSSIQAVFVNSWVARLAKDVHLWITLRHTGERIIYPSTYDADLPGKSYTLHLRKAPYDADAISLTIKVVRTIIAEWLDFPQTSSAQYGGAILYAIANSWGPGALYLNNVWLTYKTPYRWAVSSGAMTQDALNSVIKQIHAHPLACDSMERSLVNDLYEDIQRVLDPNTPPPPTLSLHPPRMIASSSRYSPQPMEASSSTPTSLQLSPQQHGYLDDFVQYLRDSDIVASTDPSQRSHFTSRQKLIAANPNKRLGLRELGPDRQRSLSNEGPFSPQHCQTNAGFFSALIWRGVTCYSPFASMAKLLFTSVEDFKSEMQRFEFEANQWAENHPKRKPVSFYCDMGAFGSANTHRKLSLVDEYGKWLEDANSDTSSSWPEWLNKNRHAETGLVPFTTLHAYLQKFSAFGPLIAYTLAIDFSYSTAGISRPDVKEMGLIIRDLNKGAIAGLERMGFISSRQGSKEMKKNGDASKSSSSKARSKSVRIHPSPTEVVQGFTIFHQEVLDRLSEEEQRRWRYDVDITEWSLCKIRRVT